MAVFDGWIEQIGENGGRTYTYRSDINTVEEAEAAGFSNVSGVSDSYTISNDNYGYKYNLNSDGTYTFNQGIFSSTSSVFDLETFTTIGGSTITGYKCTTCPIIDRPIATNSMQYQMGSASGQLGVAAYYGLQTFAGIVAGEAVLGAVGLSGGISLSGYATAGDALGGLGVQTSLRTLPVTNALSYDARIALQTNLYHSFPNSFDAHIINNGSWSQRIKDGANWYEMSGSINGVKGNYQIGLTHWNKVFHKNFKPIE